MTTHPNFWVFFPFVLSVLIVIAIYVVDAITTRRADKARRFAVAMMIEEENEKARRAASASEAEVEEAIASIIQTARGNDAERQA